MVAVGQVDHIVEKICDEARKVIPGKNLGAVISKEAKDLEAERDLAGRKADRFDGGEAFLEIGLVICSITLLTKRRLFWFGGMLVGALGVALALTGFFLH